jgi:hypothetical protein
MTNEELIVELSRDLKITQGMAERYHNYWQLELEKRVNFETKLAGCEENLKWANDKLDSISKENGLL